VPAANGWLQIASLVRGTTVTSAVEETLPPLSGGRPIPLPAGNIAIALAESTLLEGAGGMFTAFVAVTVTLVAEVTEGAVKSPVLEMVPALAFHTTAVLLVEVRVAANCWWVPEEMVVLEGETLSLMLELFGTEDCAGMDDEMLEQPFEIQIKAERSRAIPSCLRDLTNGLLRW
jgi:hypothetical protein